MTDEGYSKGRLTMKDVTFSVLVSRTFNFVLPTRFTNSLE
jgi:hypothetical protein